jgi:hypothetical protein
MHAMAARRQSKGPHHPPRTTGARIAAASIVQGEDRTTTITRVGIALLLVAVVALVCVVRIRLAGVPLERDEGEYAYAGQLILKGVPPYAAVYNMKFPGLYYAYAVIMAIFGQTPSGIRLGLLFVHLASLALLFMWARRLAGELAAGIGTAAFGLLALDGWSMGVFAHATHFVVLFVLAGLVILQGGRRSWRLVVSGVLFGLAIVMKQQAIPFALLAVWLGMRGRQLDPEPRRDQARRARSGRRRDLTAGPGGDDGRSGRARPVLALDVRVRRRIRLDDARVDGAADFLDGLGLRHDGDGLVVVPRPDGRRLFARHALAPGHQGHVDRHAGRRGARHRSRLLLPPALFHSWRCR